jgi:hypothetical protein
MDDFGWSGRTSKCMMWCSRLVFVLWAMENSAGNISLSESYPGNQLTKHTNNCFPTIAIDLDTSNG